MISRGSHDHGGRNVSVLSPRSDCPRVLMPSVICSVRILVALTVIGRAEQSRADRAGVALGQTGAGQRVGMVPVTTVA